MSTEEFVYLWEPGGFFGTERITCLHCNEILHHKQAFSRKKWCNAKCRAKYYAEQESPNKTKKRKMCVKVDKKDKARTSKKCPICNSEVKPPRTRYCSHACYKKQNNQNKRKRPVEKPGWVYLAVSPLGYYKVGFTQRANVESRIGRWLTGHPGPLKEVVFINASISLERRLHKRLEDHHVKGGGSEWYKMESFPAAMELLESYDGKIQTLQPDEIKQ